MSVRDLIPWGRSNDQIPTVFRDGDRDPFLSEWLGAGRAASRALLQRIGEAWSPGPSGRPQWRWSTIGRSLSLDAKRSILINWTWIEHLIDQVPDESISKDSRPSRLKEVEEALLDLQRHAA